MGHTADYPHNVQLVAPNAASAGMIVLGALDAAFRTALITEQALESPEGRTAASQQERVIRGVRDYTEEELRVFEEADTYPPGLREQVRAFLEE